MTVLHHITSYIISSQLTPFSFISRKTTRHVYPLAQESGEKHSVVWRNAGGEVVEEAGRWAICLGQKV